MRWPQDFDGDGYSELAVGVPFESSPSAPRAGVVHILKGSPSGLQCAGSMLFDQNGLDGAVAQVNDYFGLALAIGDLTSTAMMISLLPLRATGWTASMTPVR